MTRPSGDRQLALAAWVLAHRKALRVAGLWVLGLAAAASFAWSGVRLTLYGLDGGPIAEHNLAAVADAQAVMRDIPAAPVELSVDSVAVVSRDAQHADLVAFVTNSNQGWTARSVTYHFTVDGVAVPSVTSFSNQASTRPYIQRNVSAASSSPEVHFVIERVDWGRGLDATMPAAEFDVSKSDLTPTTVSTGHGSFITVTLKATITNRSVYGYHLVRVPIILKNGEQIVGLDELSINEWPALKDKSITLTWPYPITEATIAEIQPQVSRTDTTNVYR